MLPNVVLGPTRRKRKSNQRARTGVTSSPQRRSGQIKADPIMGKIRVLAAPEIPTTDELGVPALHVTFWFGLWAPKGTPKLVVARLNAAVAEALGDPVVRQRITGLGAGFQRASCRRLKLLPPSTSQRSTNGGRLSTAGIKAE